jgi:phosphatidylglycerophosphate synthase
MSFRNTLKRCRTGLVPEHYLYFKLLSPTAGVGLAAIALTSGMRPNAVTLVGLSLAAPIAALNLSGHMLWACALLHCFYGVDCADGILARATGQTSRAGAFLDDVAHLVVPPTFFLSLAFWAMSQSQPALAVAAATYTATELIYRNLIHSLKHLPSTTTAGDPVGRAAFDPLAWVLSSFHLPTASVFVMAAVAWPPVLTAYLAYASASTALYSGYAAYRIMARLDPTL